MLNFWLRNLLLWSSRFAGAIRSPFRKPLVLHLLVFALIAGTLWSVDNRRMIWRKSADTVKNGIGRLPLWGRAPTSSAARPDDNRNNQEAKGAENTSGPAKPTPTEAEPAQQESDGGNKGAAKPVTGELGKGAESQPDSKRWLTVWNALSVWAFCLVAWSVAKARRRLVITFEGHTGKQSGEDHTDKETGIDAGGFGVLVSAELASLSALFSEFEEGRNIQSTPEKMKPIDATFQTDSAGEFLQNTISSDTKFSFGPLQIPVGVILGLVGRMVQGPRIIGQIHRDTSQRIITVRLVGSLGNRAWILMDPALASAADKITWRPAAELANDLACRLFAELAMDRAVAWQALSQFVAGVRAYRRSLQTPKQHKLNLREAEHRLMQAQADDPGFDLAFYNLGVVYNEQGKSEAACTAFTRAAEKNNRRSGTQYALALINFNLAQSAAAEAAGLYLSKAIEFCNRALELKPPPEETTRILGLKGFVFWWRAWRWPAGSGIQIREFRSAGKMVRRAVWNAWRVLCRIELGLGISAREKPSALEQARSLASRHLENRSQMLLEVANIMSATPGGTDQSAAQEASKGWSGLSGLLIKTISRGGSLLIWVGAKLTSPKRIRAISLRVACYSLRQASSLTPAEASVWLALGKTYLKRNKYKDAIPALEAASRRSPASSDAWGFLARAYAGCERYNEVQEAAQNFLAKFSGATAESLNSLQAALDATKEPYVEIQEFVTSIQREKETRTEVGFLLWFMQRYFRLSYRLAGRELRGLTASSPQLNGLLASPDVLKQVLDAFDAARNRTQELTAFPEKIQALRRQGKEGVEQLKTLMTEKAAGKLHWEVGEVGHNLSLLYRELDQLTEAVKCLGDTISYLEKCLPNEIQRRGLYTLQAQILRRQGDQWLATALEQAKKGVAWDPISPYERTELGWVYWRLADFPSAQSAWEDVLLLTPDEPRLQVNLGLVHLAQVPDSKNKLARRCHIDSATQCLKTALELFEDADPGRNQARWLLAQAYAQAGEYTDAVRELRTLDRTDYCDLAVEISLADACLSNSNWVEAEDRFRKAVANVDQRIETTAQGVNEVPDCPVMFDHVLGTVSAWAHLGIASSLAEREIFLDEALRQVEHARKKVAELANEELKKEWDGNCFFHEGFIHIKRDHIDEAVDRLEKALAARVDADTYFTFANALTRKGELTSEPGPKGQFIRRAIAYYQEALRLDWDGRLESKINRALSQMQPVATTQAASAT